MSDPIDGKLTLRKRIHGFLIWLGDLLDIITITGCMFLCIDYAREGDAPNALLALIASGVWCISSKVYDIHALLKEAAND